MAVEHSDQPVRNLLIFLLNITYEERVRMNTSSRCQYYYCATSTNGHQELNESCGYSPTPLNLPYDNHPEDSSRSVQIEKYIHLYIYPIFILIGIIGNSLSCLIMLINVRRARAYPASLYLTFLALVDCLFLLGSALPDWISQLNSHWDIRRLSDFSCPLTYWFGNFITHVSAGLVVSITIERFIAVQYPLIAHKINTITRTRLVLVFIFIFFLILDSPVFTLVRRSQISVLLIVTCENQTNFHYERHDMPRCIMAPSSYGHTWVYVDCIVYTLIPFLIIATLNSLIIRRLIDAQRFRQHMFRLNSSSSSRYEPSETNKHRPYSDHHQAIELMDKSVRYIRPCHSMAETRPLAVMLRPRPCQSFSSLEDRRRRYHHTKQSSISTEFSTLSLEIKMRSQHHSETICSLRQQKSLNCSRANHTRLTILLLFVSCSFLILTLPHVAFNLILSTKTSSKSSKVNNNSLSSIINEENSNETVPYFTIARLCMIINHSINFILYLLLGKRFRRDMKQFFLNYWRKLLRRRRRR